MFITKDFKKACLSALVYGVMILPIQLSHFFTVDSFLNFFVFLTFSFLVYFYKTKKKHFIYFSAISFGLAFASKISAIYFIPIVFIFLFLDKKNFLKNIFIFLFISFLTIRIFQPYFFIGLFKLNLTYLNNFKSLQSFNYNLSFPPALQWFGKLKIIYPLYNIIFWGLGLPLSLITILVLPTFIKNKSKIFKIVLIWISFLILFQGSQFVQSIRYFLPIYPFISLIIGISFNFKKTILKKLLFLHFIYLIFFLSIFLKPHTRHQASLWLYKNTTKYQSIAVEYWDDALPLVINGFLPRNQIVLDMASLETKKKWLKINSQFKKSDYLILSSNRIWLPILNNSKSFPKATSFYQNLFNNKLNFKLVKEFTSYPGVSLPFLDKCFYLGFDDNPFNKKNFFEYTDCDYPGFYLRDDLAEEAFSVYDHPKVLIFQKR
jgi:hypothetical protein